MKKAYLFIILGIIFASCQKEEKISLAADKFYLVEYTFYFMDDYDMQFFVKSFIEIDSTFNINVFSRENTFYKWDVALTDSIKARINNTIYAHSRDTSFYDESRIRIYDGYYYFLLIEKAGGKQVFIDLDTDGLYSELKPLYNEFPKFSEPLNTENKKEASHEAYKKIKELVYKVPQLILTRNLPPPLKIKGEHIHYPKLIIGAPQGIKADSIDYRIFEEYDK